MIDIRIVKDYRHDALVAALRFIHLLPNEPSLKDNPAADPFGCFAF